MNGFHSESNIIRYLCNAVLGKKQETTPLKNISTTEYNSDQLVMILNECVHIEREIERQVHPPKRITVNSLQGDAKKHRSWNEHKDTFFRTKDNFRQFL